MSSLLREKFKLHLPIPSIMPSEWSKEFTPRDNLIFDNLSQFIFTMSKLTLKNDSYCGMDYETSLGMLVRRESDFPEKEQDTVRNLVRKNLLKRGLITQEVYENFKYTTDGTNLGYDIGKFAAGEADCVLSPSREYIDFFYELYVNVSYSGSIDDSDIRNNVAKLLATVEELERKHIFIKIVVVDVSVNVAVVEGKGVDMFIAVPVFSHKDQKSVSTMSSVINERFLRKFSFAISEDLYGSTLSSGYGSALSLSNTINIGHELNEIELFGQIVKEVGAE